MPNARMLQVTTPTDRVIEMTREFDAPRHLVWEAMTKPEFVRRWLYAPEGWAMTVCEMDVRVGGRFRWAWNGPDGKHAMAIWGEHREVVPPEKVVHTESMEVGGAELGQLVATLVLTEKGGVTTMRMTLVFPSKEARDGALASGMEHGMNIGYQRLDTLLPTMRR
jgi:uncharacterized protein YndB with AHSA1/START domain